MERAKFSAFFLIVIMFLAGCTSPSNDDSNEEKISKPTLILNAEFTDSSETSIVEEIVELSVLAVSYTHLTLPTNREV